MANKNFALGFVLSATLSSKFLSSFAKASQNVEELFANMEKMCGQAGRMKGVLGLF